MRNRLALDLAALSLAVFLAEAPPSTPRPDGKIPPNHLEKTRNNALSTKHGTVINKGARNEH